MEAFFWAALGFLVVALLAGCAFVGVRAWRAWQAFASLAAGAGGGVDRLLTSAEELAAHVESTTARSQELTAAVDRLGRTRARARILLGATGELGDLLRTVRSVVAPQK
jgi:hypothetical protein